MFSVAICDDEEVLCSQLENYLQNYIDRGLIKTEVFYSAEALYRSMQNGDYYDLVFLDIEFRRLNGVDLAKKIRNELENDKTQIVFISAKQKYAMELFEIRPMNFLIKPISAENLLDNVDKAMALSDLYDTYFEFKFGSENYRIPYGNIRYFESKNRKVYIHTKYGVKEVYEQLNRIEKGVPSNFIRIHKSFLINRYYVTRWNSESIYMGEDTILSVSQPYRKNMCKILINVGRGNK